jgi:hypothetical protein
LKTIRPSSDFGWRRELRICYLAQSSVNAAFEEAGMRSRPGAVSSLLFIVFLSCAQAEDGLHAQQQTRRPVLTGKERLGPKWTDEQRIDNCNVPIDKRGTRSRPSACANSPSS